MKSIFFAFVTLLAATTTFAKTAKPAAPTAPVAAAAPVVPVKVAPMEMNGVTYEGNIKAGDTDLVLNGIGLRKVTKFGFPIKVYVGALYVTKKTTSSEEVLNSNSVKQVALQFVLSVDRDALNETFGNTYNTQCLVDCANSSKQFVKLRDVVARVNKGDRFVFTSYPDKLVFEIVGSNAKKVEIADAAVSKNAIAMFLNPKAPPTPELRNGLLGLVEGK